MRRATSHGAGYEYLAIASRDGGGVTSDTTIISSVETSVIGTTGRNPYQPSAPGTWDV